MSKSRNKKPSKVAQLLSGEPIQKKTKGSGLADNLKAGIENLSGLSMEDVNVHNNSSQPSQLNALRYAKGTNIKVTASDEQHLPHETWHVVQQQKGRVKPTIKMEGIAVNNDKSLEEEADVMGKSAIKQKDL